MAKQYFQHDYNAGDDIKCASLIKRYGMNGYGIYWRINELLHQEAESKLLLDEAVFELLSDTLNVTKKILQNCIAYCVSVGLYKKEGDHIYSERVLKNKQKRESITEQKRLAGKRSAEQRAAQVNTGQQIATGVERVLNTIQQTSTDVNTTQQTKLKEIKLNETKEEDGISNNTPPPTFFSLPPVGFIPIDECAEKYKTNQYERTRELLVMKHDLKNMDNLLPKVKQFNDRLLGAGETHKNYADWMEHFAFWLAKPHAIRAPTHRHGQEDEATKRIKDKLNGGQH